MQWNDLATELNKKPTARDEAPRIVGASDAGGAISQPRTQIAKREPYVFVTHEKNILVSTAKSQPESLGLLRSTKASAMARYDLLTMALHAGKHNMAANDPDLPVLTESDKGALKLAISNWWSSPRKGGGAMYRAASTTSTTRTAPSALQRPRRA